MLGETNGFYKTILDAIPTPVFVIAEGGTIFDYNATAARMLAREPDFILRRHAGEVLHCLHSTKLPERCGSSPYCHNCVIRSSINRALAGEKVVRQKARMELVAGEKKSETYFLVTTAPFENQGRRFVLLILEDIGELIRLRSILPICAHCKKIRDDANYWQDVAEYLTSHADIEFSHGLCPQCLKDFYPEFSEPAPRQSPP